MSPARPKSRCPRCGAAKSTAHYLCRLCWGQLPRHVQAALYRRDALAQLRLRELYRQIHEDVALHEIQVTS
jgi:predicted amidophosphoribosyltransferase